MKRKIAAIMAADIAGYSRLVAEDEEETLRRLESYRAVFNDFIVRGSGRVFNTAGDAILAEFASSVEAVRCAIDMQESLRTRNLAYPPSRQMHFRIGITIGDVVERDGDLLGDGVNIAARLEGLAQPGGLCISSSVYEQVANKLSVQFADIGEQEVKNIPNPVHAYTLSIGGVHEQAEVHQVRKAREKGREGASWVRTAAIVGASVAALAAVAAVVTGVVLMALRHSAPTGSGTSVTMVAPPVEEKHAEVVVPDRIPFISDRDRADVGALYLPAPDYKALAVSYSRIGMVTGQADAETAKSGAMENCRRSLEESGLKDNTCWLFAIGNTVVYQGGYPPMPPRPWFRSDPSIEKPFNSMDVPLVGDRTRSWIEKNYPSANKPKALTLSPRDNAFRYRGASSRDEAVRRSLEGCGSVAGIPCMLIAVDDMFVVPIPATMKVVGFFHTTANALIEPGTRDEVARRLGGGSSGWSAVAAGANGLPGVAVGAGNEQNAIDAALADCGKRDRGCRIIAIGPFSVEAAEPAKVP